MTSLKIDYSAAMALEDADSLSGGPSLDPSVPLFWWVNGKRQLLPVHPVLGCGGWATDAPRFGELLRNTGRPYPSTLQAVTVTTRDGRDLEVYTAQNLLIAPIARRSCWYDDESKRVATRFEPGLKRRQQMLAMFGESLGDIVVPWGAVCLSLRGFQVDFLRQATEQWARHSYPARVALTQQLHGAGRWPDPKRLVPERLFWMPLGSFGGQPKTVMVGKTAQSPITPVTTSLTNGSLTLEQLQALYIGPQCESEALQVLEAHRDWLDAWRESKSDDRPVHHNDEALAEQEF